MDITTATAVLTLAGKAIDLFDKFAGQVGRFITKKAEPAQPKEYRYKVDGKNGALQVSRDGRNLQTITAHDLAKLPPDQLDHIRVLEKSMERHYNLWKSVYPKRNDSADPMVNAKVEQQLRDLVLEMKGDLTGIIDFLQSLGVYLDDHYVMMRNVIDRYR